MEYQNSIRRARLELGCGSQWRRAAVSYYLAACACDAIAHGEASYSSIKVAFKQDRRATLGKFQPTIERWLQDRLHRIVLELQSMPECRWEGVDDSVFRESLFLERTIHLALERLFVNAAAPPLLVSPVSERDRIPSLGSGRTIVVLFDWPLGFTHEFYPLWTDAFVYSQSHRPETPLHLLGAHASWLNRECCLTRMIHYDPDTDVFLETPLERPLKIAASILLCQPPDVHRHLSERLSNDKVFHINPYRTGVEIADDKWRCYEKWREASVPTPVTCLLERNRPSDVVRRLASDFIGTTSTSKAGWMIQPRHGTEGKDVYWIPPHGSPDCSDVIMQYWRLIAEYDDAILRPRVGLVYVRRNSEDSPRAFDIRYYVSFDGRRFHVESGYLMVSGDSDSPLTSIARGGDIMRLGLLSPPNLVLPKSVTQNAMATCNIQDGLHNAKRVAVAAVERLGQLEFAGVDVKLDATEEGLVPSVLDVNPRPAGLLHADLVDSGGETGVAPGLWKRMASIEIQPPLEDDEVKSTG